LALALSTQTFKQGEKEANFVKLFCDEEEKKIKLKRKLKARPAKFNAFDDVSVTDLSEADGVRHGRVAEIRRQD
jgi:hypothetical protein